MTIKTMLVHFFMATISTSVFASSYYICGKTVNLDNGTVTGYELEISSGDDDYSGIVGETWNLKLQQDADWMAPRSTITAKTTQNGNGEDMVTVTVVHGQSASGMVGTQYKLFGLYDDEPVLEKYTMGGFAGSIKTDTFKCISALD
jgi:hypothetical protein